MTSSERPGAAPPAPWSHGPTVVHLLGFPGTGKRTIAAALVASVPRDDHRFVLVDNHLTSKAVLAALDVDPTRRIDPTVWRYVDRIRPVVLEAIRDMAPPGWSYVFTSYAVESAPNRSVPAVRRLAADRGATYVPVVLACAEAEHRRRVVGPGRAEHGKWLDPDGVMEDVAHQALTRPDSPHLLDLDVTDLAPAQAAAAVLAHLRAIGT